LSKRKALYLNLDTCVVMMTIMCSDCHNA